MIVIPEDRESINAIKLFITDEYIEKNRDFLNTCINNYNNYPNGIICATLYCDKCFFKNCSKIKYSIFELEKEIYQATIERLKEFNDKKLSENS